MKRCYIIMLLFVPVILPGFVWNIAQDGSGHFSEIQLAIDMVEDGDTLLIHPGTYYENLYIETKNLHLMSLYGITQDTIYIATTILDGSHSSNVVYSYYPSEGISLTGLTITNGYCYTGIENGFHHGAGVISFGGNTTISNCIIEFNYSEKVGGGIYIATGTLYLSGSIIRFNVAVEGGGGLCFGNDEIIFDEENLNSIYGNYGASGTDILNRVDPDFEYYFPLQKGTANPPCTLFFRNHTDGIFNVSYEETFIDDAAQEVYVSPDGDNENDGLTPDSSLKNIWYATLKCDCSGDEPGIVHLTPGTYSTTSNEEYSVTAMKSNMSMIGSGSDSTILDREDQSGYFGIICNEYNHLEGFTICNDSGEYLFPNLHISGTVQFLGSLTAYDIACNNITGLAISVGAYNEISFDNLKIHDNIYRGSAIQLSSIYNAKFRNLEIKHSMYQEVEWRRHLEGGFGIGIWNATNIQEPMHYYFENASITGIDNQSPYNYYPSGSCYALGCGEAYNNAYLINSTISGNVTNNLNSSVLGAVTGSHLYIYNSIVYDNQYHSLTIGGYASAGESYIGVSHSLVEGGFEDMVDWGQPWTADWLEGNLDIDEDPEFCGVGQSEYMLQSNSPCIDSGSLTCLPEGYELSETDLAGNPRVYGDNIDMGCYEWQGTECDFEWEQDENSVSFTVESNEDIYQVEWDFECDGEIDSNELSPVHVYTENGTYSVGVSINNGRGGRRYEYCITIVDVPVNIDNIEGILHCRNYPNPFNPRTTIEFEIPEKGEVTLSIYDIKGRKVKGMVDAVLEAGTHSFIWNGKNDEDKESASGIYFYELTWNDKKIREKINLLK